MYSKSAKSKITVSHLQVKKNEGRKISALTAYDYPTARLQDKAGIDVILVGDSLGTNVLGYRSEHEVTLENILHHSKAVRRGVEQAFVLADMPFMSYQPSAELALISAGRLMQEGGADGVKLEGGVRILQQIEALIAAGIPAMGHLGYTPQSKTRDYYLFSEGRGTVPKYQGKGPQGAKEILDEAMMLEDAGIFAIVLEQVTEEAAQIISQRLTIPVIGIGSGRYCDGQILVVNDILGLNDDVPLPAKAYTSLNGKLRDIFAAYRREVEAGQFPAGDNAVHMEPGKLQKFQDLLGEKQEEQKL